MTRPLALLLVVLGLVLTGCRVELRTEVAVREDGSGEVAVTVVTDREVLEAAPTLADDLALDDVRAAGWLVDGPRLTPEGGLIVVVRKPFRTIDEAQEILAEVSGPGGPFRDLALAQEQSFATVATSFRGTGQLAGGLAAFGDSDLVAALGGSQPFEQAVGDRPLGEVLGITLTLLLAGEVTAAGPAGEVASDGSAASYRVPVDGTAVDLGTTSELRDDDALAARRRERLAIGGLLAWVVLLVVGGALWYLRRRPGPSRDAPRDAGPPTGAGSPGSGSGSPGPGSIDPLLRARSIPDGPGHSVAPPP